MDDKHDLNWDYLRIFLAVMRTSSLRQAARHLGCSHPTLRRHLEHFEDHLGLRLFERRTDGLHPTTEAIELRQAAEEVEASIRTFTQSASNADPALAGTIRVSAPDFIVSELLAPDLAAFSHRWPQVFLHIETTYDLIDLGMREADIAIRIYDKKQVPSGDLIGRKVAKAYVSTYGTTNKWLGWFGGEQDQEWIRQQPFPSYPVQAVLTNVYLQREACKTGMGMARLPCFMGDPYLKRRTTPEHEADVWILVHPNLQNNLRMKLFRNEMFEAFKRLRPRLEGISSES